MINDNQHKGTLCSSIWRACEELLLHEKVKYAVHYFVTSQRQGVTGKDDQETRKNEI